MFVAAAKVLADVSPAARDANAPLLPPVARLREVAFAVAQAVARQARAEGRCEPFDDEELDRPDRTQDVGARSIGRTADRRIRCAEVA